jgi:HK97 family phage prohead protease
MLKRKDAGGGIADVDKKKSIVVGYASRFGNVDSHGDIVVKGAFKRTIDHNAKRVKTLMHHDPVQIVGKPIVMREDDGGLYTETKVSDTSLGRDLLTLIEDGVLDEMSIGFIPVREKFDDDVGANLIQEVKLVEYSFVTLASNPEARVEGLKGMAAVNEIVASMKRMEKALRDGTFVSDEVPEAIEFIVKYWRSVIEASTEADEATHIVSSSPQKGDSSDEDTHLAQSDSEPSTRDGILAVLREWQEEQELLSMIEQLGTSLEGNNG